MSPAGTAIREPWEHLSDQRRAATFGMWLFVASEILFFGGLFMAYTLLRVLHPAAFDEAARHTNVVYGTLNTALLLTSSFTMVLAARLAELDLRRAMVVGLVLTAALGLGFLVVKGFEYREDIAEHLVPGRGFALRPAAAQLFFSLYWAVTGLHALHLTIGIVAVTRLAFLVERRALALPSPQFEVAALYWHIVDIVWIFLYPLLYLAGRA